MYQIIVNPASKSGRGQKIWDRIEPVLKAEKVSYQVFFSAGTGHVIQHVKELMEDLQANHWESIRFIVLGGDGTLNETLQGITDFDKVYLGYIPTGSSNDMARDLNLPKDPVLILRSILTGGLKRTVDIGCLTYENYFDAKNTSLENLNRKRYFAVSCGIGFDAAVCEEAMDSSLKDFLNKIKLGKLTYLFIALKQILTAKKVSCDFYLEDGKAIRIHKLLFLAVMIHKYEGGGFKFCPDAVDHDGILDICAAGDISKPKILCALPTAFKGKHFMFAGIDSYRCKEIRIQTSSPLWVHTDGEVNAKSSHIIITCNQQKLQLLI